MAPGGTVAGEVTVVTVPSAATTMAESAVNALVIELAVLFCKPLSIVPPVDPSSVSTFTSMPLGVIKLPST